jgi:hypothetical protein
MRVSKAHVREVKLVLDDPTDRPDGAEARVALFDDLDEAERAALDDALDGYLRATFETPYQFASVTNSAAVDTNGDRVADTCSCARATGSQASPSTRSRYRPSGA